MSAAECASCRALLAPQALVCTRCHALVHAQQLERLAATARVHEENHESAAARDAWGKALQLLPPDSAQAKWIRDKTGRSDGAGGDAALPAKRDTWIAKLGPFAPFVLLLAKGKSLVGLFKLKFLLTFGAFVALYWSLYGVRFGIGFAVLILVHEMGHFIEVRRRGLPADMPVFLPGLGAYVRWAALGVTPRTRSMVSLAGPMAGLIGAAVCALLWLQTGDALWVGLASLSAMLNILNLIPVWVLDGGQAIAALDRHERIILAAGALVMAAYFSQPALLLVAGGAGYRVFTKDRPANPDHFATVYYLLVLAGLGYIMTLAPSSAALLDSRH